MRGTTRRRARVASDEPDLPADWGGRPYGVLLEVGAMLTAPRLTPDPPAGTAA